MQIKERERVASAVDNKTGLSRAADIQSRHQSRAAEPSSCEQRGAAHSALASPWTRAPSSSRCQEHRRPRALSWSSYDLIPILEETLIERQVTMSGVRRSAGHLPRPLPGPGPVLRPQGSPRPRPRPAPRLRLHLRPRDQPLVSAQQCVRARPGPGEL